MSIEKLIEANTAALVANTEIQSQVLAALTSKTSSGTTAAPKAETKAAPEKAAPKKAAPKKAAAKVAPTGEELVNTAMEHIKEICAGHPAKSDEQAAAIADIRTIMEHVGAKKASEIPHDRAQEVIDWLVEYSNGEVPEPLASEEPDEDEADTDSLI